MSDAASTGYPNATYTLYLSNAHDVEYWTRFFGCTEVELREAVFVVGTGLEPVWYYLVNHRP